MHNYHAAPPLQYDQSHDIRTRDFTLGQLSLTSLTKQFTDPQIRSIMKL